jgi:hypothetical protein
MSEELIYLNRERGPMGLEELRAQRARYHEAAGPELAAVAETYGKYAEMPVFLDVSHWQGKDVNGTLVSRMDWKYLGSKKEYMGVYVKVGEAYGSRPSGHLDCDYWFDVLADSHLSGALAVGSWTAMYEMYEPAWAVNRGIHHENIEDQFSGADNDTIATQIMQDPNIYIFARKLKKVGRAITGASLRAAAVRFGVDALVIDLEKWYTAASKAVGDMEMGFTLGMTLKGLRWLMMRGYLPTLDILIYTSNWFLTEYGNLYTRNVVDHEETIPAGYWWNQDVLGTLPVTWEQLLAELAKVRDSWHPVYVGAKVFGLQISGDYFKFFDTKMDINVCKLTWEQLKARYPTWWARRLAGQNPVPDPEPEPEPEPEPVITSGKVAGANGVRMRVGPTTSYTQVGVLPKGHVVDVAEVRAVGSDVWVRINRSLWMCAKQGTATLITLE